MQRISSIARPLLRATVHGPAGGIPANQQLNALPLHRCFTTTPQVLQVAGRAKIATIDDKLAEFTLDETIEAGKVRVKSEDGILSDPRPLREVLGLIDRSTSHVMQLARLKDTDQAVVQIVSRADLIQRIKNKELQEREVKKAEKVRKPKQLELNWAISSNDLLLKLRQMEEFLKKGKKVEILLANKRRQRKASVEEAQTLYKTIMDRLEEVGAVEVTPMEGAILRQTKITVKIP